MSSFPHINGFELEKLISTSRTFQLVTAIRKADQQEVMLKILNPSIPAESSESYLLREQLILKKLQNEENFPVPNLHNYNGSYFAEFPFFGEKNLEQHLKSIPLSAEEFFDLAIKVIRLLIEVHKLGIVHRNINPTAIIYNPSTRELQLNDFCISSQIDAEYKWTPQIQMWQTNLSYISPELSGRMKRAVDHRSDIYSLGMVFYSMLTGQIPFPYNEPHEIIYAHLTQYPVFPAKITQSLAPIVLDCINKMTAKMPEERYQSMQSLLYDMEFISSHLYEANTLKEFRLGMKDKHARFLTSEKLYGRDADSKLLKNIFEEVINGQPATLIIEGNTGSGKTALLRELFKKGIQHKSYFIEGRYDPLKNNIPFYGISMALSEFIKMLAGESESKLNIIRNQLSEVLGLNLTIIMNLVPELEKIIDRPSESVDVSLSAAESRLFFTMREFAKIIATAEHPLVVFLNDLQWSDVASVKLIQELSGKIPYVLPIFSYNPDELTSDHIINEFLESSKSKPNHHFISLKNLSVASIEEMLSDIFLWKGEQLNKIAHTIHSKTDGNPFFIKQFIRSLYDKRIIQYNEQDESWLLDEKKLTTVEASLNVINVLSQRYDLLDTDCKDLLELAACIGFQFDLNTLCKYKSQDAKFILDKLWQALNQELIVPTNDQYLLITGKNDFGAEFKFQSDGILKKIQSSTLQSNSQSHHAFIASLKLQQYSLEEQEDNIFDIVNHITESEIQSENENENFKHINLLLIAGKKAQASISYQSAMKYFNAGIQRLKPGHWDSHYNLCFDLHFGHAQNAYQSGNVEYAESTINTMFDKAKNNLDHVKILSLRLRQYTTLGKTEEAISQGVKGLGLLGIKIPEKPGQLDVLKEVLKVKWKLRNKNPESLLALPVMENEEMKLAARLLTEVGPAAFILGNDNLYALTSLKVVNLSIEFGNCGESSFAYTAYGAVLGEAFNDYKSLEAFGKLAVNINQKLDNHEFRCRVIAAYGVLMHHFTYHWKDHEKWFQKGVEAGYESGDLFFLAYCAANTYVWNPLTPVSKSVEQQRGVIPLLHDTHFKDAIDTARINLQSSLQILGKTTNPESLDDEYFTEEGLLEEMRRRKYNSGLGMYNITKAGIHLHLHQYDKALIYALASDSYRKSLIGLIHITKLNTYSFFIIASIIPKISGFKKWQYKSKIKSLMKKMRVWADFNPNNFQHLYELMFAEWSVLEQKHEIAIANFQKAIENAGLNDYPTDQAFAMERYSFYLQNQGNDLLSIPYLQNAIQLYKSLDWNTKVNFLTEKFQTLQSKYNKLSLAKTVSEVQKSDQVYNIDMGSLMNASQALAGEIKLDALIEKILHIILMNAGSEYGVLYLQGQNTLRPQAMMDKGKITMLQNDENDSLSVAPISVINYVSHLKQAIVLEDACQSGNYINDPYIASRKTRSILCAPVIHLSRLYAIIYLENNKMAGAFTDERLALVNLLTTQMAISIQNALLYSSLEEKVASRTEELSNSYNQLKETQTQLIHSEKMASLGELTAGIAHEIQNPLNFINNFSELNLELIGELNEAIDNHDESSIKDLTENLKSNAQKVVTHGKRAESIVKGMLQHSRKSSNQKEPTDINNLADELIRLSYHGMRAKNKSFNASFQTDFTIDLPKIPVINQDIGRVILNMLNNAFYAVDQKTLLNIEAYSPKVIIRTYLEHNYLVLEINDNGCGIPESISQKIFQPFFTTKPTGQGTGLGLSLSYDIVYKGHNGKIELNTKEHSINTPLDSFTTFKVKLPLK